jgi:hypothetical protein
MMATSRMNSSTHTAIIQSILDVSKDDFISATRASRPRGFKHSLDGILSDFQDQIMVSATQEQDSRAGRCPETPVQDTCRVYHVDVRWRCVRELYPCTDHSRSVTVDFIEKIFGFAGGPARRVSNQIFNITWGTLLRYLQFIQKHSEGFICPTIEGECSWEDHSWHVSNLFIEITFDDTNDYGAGGVPEYFAEMFNCEEDYSMTAIDDVARRFDGSRTLIRELGYLMPAQEPTQEPVQEPAQEPTQEPAQEPALTQINNESLRKLQDIIDSVSRGEKSELNEGEYLQLSDYLKGLFVS